jgi:hypothetical protein
MPIYTSPVRMRRRNFSFCQSVPCSRMVAAARVRMLPVNGAIGVLLRVAIVLPGEERNDDRRE